MAATRAPENLSEIVGRVLWGGFSGPPSAAVPDRFCKLAREGRLGGAILFKRNIDDLAQTQGLLTALRRSFWHKPILSVDQEGGRVRRLHAPVLDLPAMRVLGDIDDPELTERSGRVLGRHLGIVGFNCDFAPVLDVDTNPANPVIGDRAFGDNPEVVIRHAAAFARGLSSAGILACGKHFPGHGDTLLDSHLALPRVSHDLARLRAVELEPFRATIKTMPMLMSAHVIFDALDPELPATLSRRAVIGILREEWGFEGLVVSDDLEMKAVSEGWGIPKAAVLAIEAGCDSLLVCSDLDALERAHAALLSRAQLDERFLARIADASERCRKIAEPLANQTDDLAAIRNDEEARALERSIRERSR